MTFRSAPLLVPLLAAAVACSSENPEPQVAIYPTALVLRPVSPGDTQVLWENVSLLNETFFNLEVSEAEITGPGSAFLELNFPGDAGVRDLPLRGSMNIGVRPLASTADRLSWATGEYEATLNFTVGGTGKLDPATLEPDTTAWQEIEETVAITFTLNCDLDGDGYDDEACGGFDCEDQYDAINPGAVEECDGIDNNCSGFIDETCGG